SVPVLQPAQERLTNRWEAEVDDARRAAAGGRDRSRAEVVGRARPLAATVEVGVRIDATGEQVGAGRVDHPAAIQARQIRADLDDPPAGHAHVGAERIRRGYNRAAG